MLFNFEQGPSQRGHVPPMDGQVPLWRKSALRAERPEGTFPPLLPFSALRAKGLKGSEGQKVHFEGPKGTLYGNFMLFDFETPYNSNFYILPFNESAL